MKLLSAVTGIALTLLSTLPAFAQAPAQEQEELTRWYLRADAGGQWTDDIDLEEFLGPVAPGSQLTLNPGLRLGVAGGYQVTDWFAVEASAGFQHSEIDDVTGASDVDGRLSNYPVLLGGRLQYKSRCPVTPYAGAGVGFATTALQLDDLNIGFNTVDGTDFDMVFSWQVFVGLEYRLNERMSVGLEYHYVATDGAEFEVDDAFFSASDTLRLGEVQSHSVSLTFNYQF